MSPPTERASGLSADYASIPLSPLRKVIATRMAEAKRTIPHFRVSCDVNAGPLATARQELSNSLDGRVSINDLVIKGCAFALMKLPGVNVQYEDGEIRQFTAADITMITAVDGGLLTPVIRAADRKSIAEIAAETKSLAQRAAAKALKLTEITGGSFGVSNLGMFGVEAFDAIINPPQCAMLAVGAMRPGFIFDELGQPSLGRVMRLTLSVDHRAIDGALAGRFLNDLRRRLEAPPLLAQGAGADDHEKAHQT